ncbi:hypothetical protein H7Q97_13925 [Ochrobactrum sp. CM-21-5]|nr:hypothetical protein [Ochrobactrum sp. CM-21-5]MBC2886489.1 hypothetical protein [Ochrobactrum sp. CM-21-5]
MTHRVEVPAANLRNIDQFEIEPSAAIVSEIKQHIKDTADPCSWWGHSHTAPPPKAFVVYLDDFDVPAPKGVRAVAPCPCCSPFHAKYKNGGKIAWFPHEKVIRLIGPYCFAAINAEGHEGAMRDLKRRKKIRSELDIITGYLPRIGAMIKAMEETIPIAYDLDALMFDLNKAFDEHFRIRIARHVLDGILRISKTMDVPFLKPDGEIGKRKEETFETVARIQGHAMIDRTGKATAQKLEKMRVGLKVIADRLESIASVSDLSDVERQRFAVKLPECRGHLSQILEELSRRQLFLTTEDLEKLDEWGRHNGSPVSIEWMRQKNQLLMRTRYGSDLAHVIAIGSQATTPLPAPIA